MSLRLQAGGQRASRFALLLQIVEVMRSPSRSVASKRDRWRQGEADPGPSALLTCNGPVPPTHGFAGSQTHLLILARIAAHTGLSLLARLLHLAASLDVC